MKENKENKWKEKFKRTKKKWTSDKPEVTLYETKHENGDICFELEVNGEFFDIFHRREQAERVALRVAGAKWNK